MDDDDDVDVGDADEGQEAEDTEIIEEAEGCPSPFVYRLLRELIFYNFTVHALLPACSQCLALSGSVYPHVGIFFWCSFVVVLKSSRQACTPK
jgi:hypothetical protein